MNFPAIDWAHFFEYAILGIGGFILRYLASLVTEVRDLVKTVATLVEQMKVHEQIIPEQSKRIDRLEFRLEAMEKSQ